jgi:hypothetical protein
MSPLSSGYLLNSSALNILEVMDISGGLPAFENFRELFSRL